MQNGFRSSDNKTLGTILEIIMGHQNATEGKLAQVQGTIPVILSGDLKNTKHISIKNYTTSERLQAEKIERKLLTQERVLLALSWPGTAGKLGIFRGEAIHNKAVAALVPKEPMNIDFLFYMLKYMKYAITYEVNVDGKTSSTLKYLNSLPVPLYPSLQEQKRLADQLDTLFQQIEKERNNIEQMQGMVRNLLQDALQDAFAPGHIKSWKQPRLQDLVTLIKQPVVPQSEQHARYLYIDDTCITPGRGELSKKLVWGEQRQRTQQTKNLLQNARGSILYVRANPAKQRAALLDIDEVLCHPNIAALRIKDEYRQQLLPDFLLWSLLSPTFTAFATNGHQGKSPPISEQKFRSYEIPLPSRDTQHYLVKQFNAVQEMTGKMIAQLTQGNARMQHIEQQILQKFFQRV
jgi:restriction endonuclease S subunit